LNEPQVVDTYSIGCDRPRRTIRKLTRYATNDENVLIAYTLTVAQEISKSIDPSTYSEAISYPNSLN